MNFSTKFIFVVLLVVRGIECWISNSCDLGDDEITNDIDPARYQLTTGRNLTDSDHLVKVIGTRCNQGRFYWRSPASRNVISGFKIKFLPKTFDGFEPNYPEEGSGKKLKIASNSHGTRDDPNQVRRVCIKAGGEDQIKYQVFVIQKKRDDSEGKGERINSLVDLTDYRSVVGKGDRRRLTYLIPQRNRPSCYDFRHSNEMAVYVELMTWDHADRANGVVTFSYHVQGTGPTFSSPSNPLSCTGEQAVLAYCSSDLVMKGDLQSWRTFPKSKVAEIRYKPQYLYKPRIELSDNSVQTMNYDLFTNLKDLKVTPKRKSYVLMGNVRFEGENPYLACLVEINDWEKLRRNKYFKKISPCKL